MEVILKKQILSIVVALAILIPVSISVFAGLNSRVSAEIPFDFQIGGKEFKGGKYSIERVYANNPDSILRIRSADNKDVANFTINHITDRGDQKARLVFHRYGKQYFLARVYDGSNGQGSELIKSKAEREASKKRDIITQKTFGPEVVTVAGQVGQ
jgi:hypothetical protein